ncbi:MAG: hypothetical protein NC432_03220 [Roseburia sp.]|nr:hypothetical protein [Roseburia sp.]MCM1097055.1 hypothetical protein [Ruminococcus flavefaciens]
MKRKGLALAAAVMLLLTACGNGEKVISGESGGSGTAANTGNQGTEIQASGGYLFVAPGGVTVQIDAPAEPIIEALGEPASYFEAPSCAFQGIDKVYTYNSFEIDTYPQDEKDYISAVIFKDDSISTPEGVAIGDSRTKMEEAYGTDGTTEGGKVIYRKDNMKLCFILKDDSIVSIEYNTTALD